MKRLLLFLILGVPTLVTAATVTWDGGAGTNNWSDANNWDNNTLPTISDQVVITSDSVVFDLNTSIKSLTLNGAALNLQSGTDSLIITGSFGTGVLLNNNSRLYIDRPMVVHSIALNGVVINDSRLNIYKFGALIIDQIGNYGLQLDATSNLYNEVGNISISNTFFTSFTNLGLITNQGAIDITDSNSGGLDNSGMINNSGEILVENSGSFGIQNHSLLTNSGTIRITNDHFVNSSANSQVTNNGLLTFSAPSTTTGFLINNLGSIKNESSGTIETLTRATQPIKNYAFFENFGSISIAEAQLEAITNNSTDGFKNYGTIDVLKSDLMGIENTGTNSMFENLGSAILNIDSCSTGILNEGQLVNQGTINLKSGITNYSIDHNTSSDSLINSGTINCIKGTFNIRGYLLNQLGGRIATSNAILLQKKVVNKGSISSRLSSNAITLNDTLENYGTVSLSQTSQNCIKNLNSLRGFIDNKFGARFTLAAATYSGITGNIFIKNAGELNILTTGLDGINLNGPNVGIENNGSVVIKNISQKAMKVYATSTLEFFNDTSGFISIINSNDDAISVSTQVGVASNFKNFGDIYLNNIDGNGITTTLDSLFNKSKIEIEQCNGIGVSAPFILNHPNAEIIIDSVSTVGLSALCRNEGLITVLRSGSGINTPQLDNFGSILLDGSSTTGFKFLTTNGFLQNYINAELSIKNCTEEGIVLYNRLINNGTINIEGATKGVRITNQTFSDSLINTGTLSIKNCSEHGFFTNGNPNMVMRNTENGLISITNTNDQAIGNFPSTSQFINDTCATIKVDGTIGNFTNYGFLSANTNSNYPFYEFYNYGIFEDQQAQLIFDDDFHNTGIVIQPVRGTPSLQVDEYNVISSSSSIFTKDYALFSNPNKSGVIGEFDYQNGVVRFYQAGLSADTAYMFYDWANCGIEKKLTIPIRQNFDCEGQYVEASFGLNVLPDDNWFKPQNWDTKKVPDGCTNVSLNTGTPRIPAGSKARVHYLNAEQQLGANFLEIPSGTVFESGD